MKIINMYVLSAFPLPKRVVHCCPWPAAETMMADIAHAQVSHTSVQEALLHLLLAAADFTG